MANGQMGHVSTKTPAVSQRYGARDFVAKLHKAMKHFFLTNPEMLFKFNRVFAEAGEGCDRINATSSDQKHSEVQCEDSAVCPRMITKCCEGCVGQPLPPAEPFHAGTGRRLVRIEQEDRLVSVIAEKRSRFLCVVPWPSGLKKNGVTYQPRNIVECGELGTFGTVLGYTDDDTGLIWHKRGDLFASCLPLSAISVAMSVPVLRCRHCAHIVPRFEAAVHIDIHQLGLGKSVGPFVDHEIWGTACGDTHLLQHLRHVRVIGSGGQGRVLLCSVGESAQEKNYAVKVMHFSSRDTATTVYQRAVRYMSLQREQSDVHLVEYLVVRLLPCGDTIEIVMPYYEGGDLAAVIRKSKVERFEESYICSLVLQVTKALVFLHEQTPPVIHGDIKAENILLRDKGMRAVLSDFDTCRELGLCEDSISSAMGTTAWMAPETRHKRQLVLASDLWGIGLLMYVLAVLPEFPMITDPNTGVSELLNAMVWRSYEVRGAPSEGSVTMGYTSVEIVDVVDSSTSSEEFDCGEKSTKFTTLSECVRTEVQERGYSAAFVNVIGRLLSCHPGKRPRAADVVAELAEVMGES